ncbi:MAG: 2-succinyl-5-enolpyruvyl-6-hydroxy-3-cyclohexene-1-carboxylic-acid synthase [Paludibacteraceae bacterium]|nr:2-succinyl-5-enolpyruvyl-6-hydroxy-3-cyclohexene-1-carboxylic-acid synthase [Paludibacteraceae bacterium]
METTDKAIVRILAELCKAHGVQEVVLSPGSRNAPLSVAFNRMPGMTCRVVVDERSAGFFALGVALATSRPVVVVCTSGTALLDLAPAVAEAYYQSVPLIVVSADRPKEWIDQNDSQTIRQEGALANFVKRSFQLPMREEADDLWYANRMVNEALVLAQSGRKAPVHINVPLSEPLYGLCEADLSSARVIRAASLHPFRLDDSVVEAYASQINDAKRVMVLAGFMRNGDALADLFAQWAKLPNVVVVAEPISNACSTATMNHPELFFSSIDEAESQGFVPDILITVGGAIVSKSAKLFFRKHPPMSHWHVGVEEWMIDTFRCLTDRIDVEPQIFFRQLLEKLAIRDSSYSVSLRTHMTKVLQHQEASLAEERWGETLAFKILLESLPDSVALHLSNGLSVRLGQRFPWRHSVRFFANRGTSGIDGATSTAVGYSVASDLPTVLLTGDISFLYDSNALWNDFLSSKLKIVLINNGGGGIFRRLPGPPTLPEMETYFETPHRVDFAKLAAAYGVGYAKATDAHSLSDALKHLFEEKTKASLLEVVVR